MFIFITRFSLFMPKSRAWLISVTDEQEDILKYKKALFEPIRLDFRLNFLENITLPILDNANKKHEIVQILKYSSILPTAYKNKLFLLAEKYPFLVLCEHDESGKYPQTDGEIAVSFFKNKLPTTADRIVGMAVLDDDDCISLDYFDRASLYLNKNYVGKALSFGLGINCVFDENYNVKKISESYYPKVNIGLLRVGVYRHANGRIVMPSLGTHGRADKYLPVILDSREISYLWSRHPYQDTTHNSSYERIIANILKRDDIPSSVIEDKFGKVATDFLLKNK